MRLFVGFEVGDVELWPLGCVVWDSEINCQTKIFNDKGQGRKAERLLRSEFDDPC